jgi:hypothetical protein
MYTIKIINISFSQKKKHKTRISIIYNAHNWWYAVRSGKIFTYTVVLFLHVRLIVLDCCHIISHKSHSLYTSRLLLVDGTTIFVLLYIFDADNIFYIGKYIYIHVLNSNRFNKFSQFHRQIWVIQQWLVTLYTINIKHLSKIKNILDLLQQGLLLLLKKNNLKNFIRAWWLYF